ncbi:coiled-coil domain-containing protein 90B, mitochondrial [Xenopus tropicalis]|uniref:coiled-coil domain-containing protein 90B, mitochondrial n=1 Tax=Xenopus tropicalis TaxID=8364 RepID=UPI00003BA1EB|eukprot:NP_001004892.1 coiled-coil domain-containing protein 90B, mitochondrial [Xenopus tropicalis]
MKGSQLYRHLSLQGNRLHLHLFQGKKLQLHPSQGHKGTAHRTWKKGFATSAALPAGYDVRQVEITPLEQRKLTFDTHALVRELETHGFDKVQAETIVSALATLTNASIDTVYRDMVTRAQQEITVQQIMAHLDSIRKDMVILEKSEFATLRAENEKMKIELEHVRQHLLNETNRISADAKLDMNLERSRLTDLFTEQEKKLMEASTEFHKKKRNNRQRHYRNQQKDRYRHRLTKDPDGIPQTGHCALYGSVRIYLPSDSPGFLSAVEIARGEPFTLYIV